MTIVQFQWSFSAMSDYRDKYHQYLKSLKWEQIAIALRKDRGYKCEICGSTRDLHSHHLTYNNIYKETLDDLQLLCSRHHMMVHGIVKADASVPDKPILRESIGLCRYVVASCYRSSTIEKDLYYFYVQVCKLHGKNHKKLTRGKMTKSIKSMLKDKLPHYIDEYYAIREGKVNIPSPSVIIRKKSKEF